MLTVWQTSLWLSYLSCSICSIEKLATKWANSCIAAFRHFQASVCYLRLSNLIKSFKTGEDFCSDDGSFCWNTLVWRVEECWSTLSPCCPPMSKVLWRCVIAYTHHLGAVSVKAFLTGSNRWGACLFLTVIPRYIRKGLLIKCQESFCEIPLCFLSFSIYILYYFLCMKSVGLWAAASTSWSAFPSVGR